MGKSKAGFGKLCLALIAGVLVSSPARSAEIELAKVTSDLARNSEGHEVAASIKIVTNADGAITQVKYDGVNPDTGAPKSQAWPISMLSNGIVPIDPSTTMGRKAVILKASRFDPKSGGAITLDYLSSVGLFGDSRRHLDLELNHTGAKWELLINDQAGRRPIHSLRFLARRTFGKPVGIAEIIVH